MQNRTNIELFDDYLGENLSLSEVQAFEERLANDEKFRAAFEEYEALSYEISEGAEYDEITSTLYDIHTDLYPQRKIFFMRSRVLAVTGVAAAIALTVWIIDPFKGPEEMAHVPEDNGYNELTSGAGDDEAAEVEESEATEVEADDKPYNPNDLVLIDSAITETKRRPLGTCFMISDNGYFLTSKHLVQKRNKFKLQQKGTGITFESKVVYRDSLLDFAILKCHENLAENFEAVPFKFYKDDLFLGEPVFTLGYPKADIVYTKGDVSSETGFRSDSNYIEISMPANPGFSGAPLFTNDGYLAGIITANNSKKQSVTYVLKHQYVMGKLDMLEERDSLDIDISSNFTRRHGQTSSLIRQLRPYIFELH